MELEKEEHKNVHFIQLDVTFASSIENISKTMQTEFRNLDILINNAGIMFPPSKNRIEHIQDVNQDIRFCFCLTKDTYNA